MIINKRKGQFLSLLTVFTLAFIGSGHIFSEVAQAGLITGEAERAVGDPERVAEAQTYANIYNERLPYMINYSYNNAAYDLADSKQEFSSKSELEDEKNFLLDDLLAEMEQNLQGRNRASSYRCSSISPPDLEVESIDDHMVEVDIGDHIVCNDDDIDVYIDHMRGDSFEHEVPSNRFEQLLDESISLVDLAESETETEEISASETSECVADADEVDESELQSSVEDDIDDEAEEKVLEGVDLGHALSSGFVHERDTAVEGDLDFENSVSVCDDISDPLDPEVDLLEPEKEFEVEEDGETVNFEAEVNDLEYNATAKILVDGDEVHSEEVVREESNNVEADEELDEGEYVWSIVVEDPVGEKLTLEGNLDIEEVEHGLTVIDDEETILTRDGEVSLSYSLLLNLD